MPLTHFKIPTPHFRKALSSGVRAHHPQSLGMAGGLPGYDAGGIIGIPPDGGITGVPSPIAPTPRPEPATPKPSGFLAGNSMGRADAVTTTSPAGAYIVPADIVSALGEGNSISGARVVDDMLTNGPWGVKAPAKSKRRLGIPHQEMPRHAKGGDVKGEEHVPVLLSHGEYEIHPSDVVRIGKGSLKRGHRILDAWVLHERAKHIKTLRKLPGPVK